MTATSIVTAVKNNLFPNILQAERTSGSTKYRKAFLHVANSENLSFISPKIFVYKPTAGDDHTVIFLGTQVDTQATMSAPSQVYGAGKLNSDAIAGATSISVLVENWAVSPIFAVGMTIRITNMADISSGTGTAELLTIAPSGVSAAGNVITLTLTTPLANPYSATDSYVASVISTSDVVAASTVPVVSGGGAYNNSTYPILGDNIGSIQQDWTVTFTSASQYNIVGNTIGSLGTFNTTSDAVPNNPAFSRPYFTINRLGWSGTVLGTSMTFTTTPASIPIWYKRVVPAGAASISVNGVYVGFSGESA